MFQYYPHSFKDVTPQNTLRLRTHFQTCNRKTISHSHMDFQLNGRLGNILNIVHCPQSNLAGHERLTNGVLGNGAWSGIFQERMFIEQNKTTGWSDGFLQHKADKNKISAADKKHTSTPVYSSFIIKKPPENYDNQLQFPEFVCPMVQITVDPDMIWKKTRWAIKISTQRVLKDISTEFCLQTTTWLSMQRKMITGDSSCEEWLTTLTRSDSQSSNSKAKKWVSEPLMFDDILSFREKFWSQSISLCLCVAFCAFITFIAYSYKECVAFGSSVPRWCCSACLCLVLKSKRRNWSW